MSEHALPPHLLRVLRYVEAVNRGGVSPTQQEIDAFASLAPPSDDLAAPWRLRPLFAGLLEREPVTAYMTSVGWLATDGLEYRVSRLGRALLDGLQDESDKPEATSAVILNPQDPMRYEHLTREIGKAGAGLLLDPYLKPGHIDWLTTSTSIARVLVGAKRSQERDNALLPLALGRVVAAGRTPPEVRISADQTLHDRVLIGEDGQTSLLGSSLTGISVHVTAIVPLPEEAAGGYRTHVEALWRGAVVVEPRDGIVTDVDDESADGAADGRSAQQTREPATPA